jgi:hypothetical protein
MDQTATCAALLGRWVARQTAPSVDDWLRSQKERVVANGTKAFFLAFGQAPRKTGKADLKLSAEDMQEAQKARPGWDPRRWSVDQATRAWLVLNLPAPDALAYVRTLDQIFSAGEVGELVALYQALPLLPHPPAHRARASEGIRSSIRSVFCAVAYYNPYPAEQLEEGPWNQMVLKCLFMGLSLDPVTGLDQRCNPALSHMLVDYAHERWAARRPVSPELWRAVGRHADERAVQDLRSVLEKGAPLERQAAVLAILACPLPSAANILLQHAQLAGQGRAGIFSWQSIACALPSV